MTHANTNRPLLNDMLRLPVDEVLALPAEHLALLQEDATTALDAAKRTGKGNADKAAVIAAMRARGFRPADDNEADALALLLWATSSTGGRA